MRVMVKSWFWSLISWLCDLKTVLLLPPRATERVSGVNASKALEPFPSTGSVLRRGAVWQAGALHVNLVTSVPMEVTNFSQSAQNFP